MPPSFLGHFAHPLVALVVGNLHPSSRLEPDVRGSEQVS